MSKPKKVAAKDLVLAKADGEMMAGIVGIANLAAPFGQEAQANVTIENVDKAVEVLARVREANRKLKDVYDLAVKDIKGELKPYDDEKKTLSKQLTAADDAVAERLIALYEELDDEGRSRIEKRLAGAMGSTATFVSRGFDVTVTDADQVPDEFLMPLPDRAARVNKAAIGAMIENGIPAPKGVTVRRRYSITTRAADTIKKVPAK